jgi:hypothetical protein
VIVGETTEVDWPAPITNDANYWMPLNRVRVCQVGDSCTCCAWDRMQRGRKVKPRQRRPKFAVAWLWGVIDRQ